MWLGPVPPARPRRVVSLVPHLTETVFALGAGDRLAGRTRYCVRPEGAVDAVPRVGGTKDVDLDRVAALLPDLVLADREENVRGQVEAVAARGVAVLVTGARTVEGGIAEIEEVGAALGAADAAAALAARAREELAALRAGAQPFRFAVLVWRGPWVAAGADTVVADLLSQAGGAPVVEEGGWPRIDARALAGADLVLLPSEPFPFGERHRREVARAAGLPVERVHLAVGEHLVWRGAHLAEGLAWLRRALPGWLEAAAG